MEKYCKKLREWVMKIVNYEIKEMIPLTNDKNEYHERQNKCFICDKRFCYDKKKKIIKIIKKFVIIAIILVNIEVLCIVFVICNIKPLKKFL